MGNATHDHAQTAFTSGELSPRLRGRFDVDIYGKGLETCLNFEVVPTGSIRRRGGTTYIAAMTGAHKIAAARSAAGASYIVELGDPAADGSQVALRVFNDSGIVGGPPVLVQRPLSAELFVDTDKRTLYAMKYSSNALEDVTYLAEHVTEPLIAEAHVVRLPNLTFLLVAVLQDGTMAICTLNRAGQILAWWRWETDGDVVSAVVVDSTLYLAITRGALGTYLEKLPMTESGRVYVDCAITKSAAASPVTGLSHLNGKIVQVIVDGALQANKTVTAGAIALDDTGTTAVIGLPYTATAKTLPPAALAQHAQRRWVRLFLRLANSALPKVDGTRMPDRSSTTALDTPEPLRSSDFGPVSPNGEWEARGQVTLEQDLPFRTEILAVFGTLQANEV